MLVVAVDVAPGREAVVDPLQPVVHLAVELVQAVSNGGVAERRLSFAEPGPQVDVLPAPQLLDPLGTAGFEVAVLPPGHVDEIDRRDTLAHQRAGDLVIEVLVELPGAVLTF